MGVELTASVPRGQRGRPARAAVTPGVGLGYLRPGPSPVQRGPARRLPPFPVPRHGHHAGGDQEPDAPGRQPGEQAVPAPQPLVPGSLEAALVQAGRLLQGAVEGRPGHQPGQDPLQGSRPGVGATPPARRSPRGRRPGRRWRPSSGAWHPAAARWEAVRRPPPGSAPAWQTVPVHPRPMRRSPRRTRAASGSRTASRRTRWATSWWRVRGQIGQIGPQEDLPGTGNGHARRPSPGPGPGSAGPGRRNRAP